MKHISPFKFLDSYQKDDLDVFFGREKETERLYDTLSGVKLLLVYGPSGAGKTSLIECGLRNQFSDADWLAITVRRDGDLNASVFARIREQLHEPFDLDPNTRLPTESRFEFGHAVEQLFAEQYKPVYLLFDQFEELLIQGVEAEKHAFFTRLNRLTRHKTPCRVLLIMREEFIGHLSEFESLCPGIFQHRFRLEKMNRSNVRQVIGNMLDAPRYRQSFVVSDSEQLAESILTRLPDERKEIELAHVQVFLSELWDRAAPSGPLKGSVELHAGLVHPDDNLAGVLDSFLKKQLAELTPVHGGKAPMELLAAMISERYTKLQLDAGELESHFIKNGIHLPRPLPELLRELEQRRILRTLKAGEQTRFEISHDVLARVVGQNLTEEMKLREKAREIYRVYEGRAGYFSREDLDYLRPYAAYLAVPDGLEGKMRESETELGRREREELAKAKQRAEEAERLKNEAEDQRNRAEGAKTEAEARRKRARVLARIATLVAISAVISGVFGYFQRQEARSATKRAETEATNAKAAEKEANQKLILSLTAKKQRLDVELENAVRALAVYEKSGHTPLIDQTKTNIEILKREITQVEKEIADAQ